MLASCSATKHVPQGEHLLNSQHLKVEGKGLDKSALEPLIRQQPNKAILGYFRLNLGLYNLSSEKDNWFNRLLRNMGEPPVLLDSLQVPSTAVRMQQYAGYRGFYNSQVSDTIIYHKRKSDVYYNVKLSEPYRISSISYNIMDRQLADTSFIVDPQKRLIKVGGIFDSDVLKAEGERIAAEMRKRGYYQFYDAYIRYQADTSVGGRGVNLKLLLLKEPAEAGNPPRNHRLFYVDKLVINPDYNPEEALSDPAYMVGWDTIREHGVEVLCHRCDSLKEKPRLKPSVLAINNLIKVGQLYNEQDVSYTRANMNNLRQFKSVIIRFDDPPAGLLLPDSGPIPMRGSLILSPMKQQSYTWGGEVSLSGSGLFGCSLTGSYQHKNLFRGAEILDVSLTGAFQKVQVYADSAPENSYELGASVSLNIPRFLVPINMAFYRSVYSPRTQIAVSGDFQQRPDYTRALGSFTFGYSWRNRKRMTYIFNPVDMDIINVLKITDAFKASIEDNPYMLSSYQNAFLLGSTTSAIYIQRGANLRRQYHIRGDVELKGNLLWAAYKAFGVTPQPDTVHDHYEVWGTSFAQFAKFDLSFTGLYTFSPANAVAIRALGGVGIPYGNSYSLPFDKMYYAGGANSLRGWQIRTVGPGSYSPDSSNMMNHLADMRLEFNAEYRFKLFWKLEGALFADVGNVWAIRRADSREGALFRLQDLPQQIAVDWGLGLRLNLSVLIIRLDYGMRVHDPAVQGAYFVQPKNWFSNGFNSLFIALGYPFAL